MQPLFVDTLRLERAGAVLAGITLPTGPAGIATAGTDPVSAAVNEIMPTIESPVIEGLPIAEAALATTASRLTAAAGRYADTDRSLSSRLAPQELLTSVSAAEDRTTASSVAQHADVTRTTAPADLPPIPAVPTDVLQEVTGNAAAMAQPFSQIMGTAGSFTQSIAQSAQGAGQTGPLADQVLEEDQETDTQPDEQQDGQHVDGAAPGAHGGRAYADSSAAPVATPSADRAPLTAEVTDR